MIYRTMIAEPSMTVELPNGMRVTIRDDATVTVRQSGREVSPDMFDMGGEYEFTLPSATVIAERCSERNADPASDNFPREGTATIDVTHIH